METTATKATFQKYPAYKNSGVEWLGEIPTNWDVLPLFALTKLKSISNCPDLELLSVYLDLGVIRFSDIEAKRTNATSLDLSKYQKVEPGDFVLNNQQAWRGSVGVSNYKGIVSPAYIILSLSKKLNTSFANYYFRNGAMVSQYLISSKGVGTIQRNLYWPQLRRTYVGIPPKEEQTAIANFLDDKTAKIDRAIAQKEKMIALLKERKQIIIQNAVTKGLNPHVKLKDSGVEWIGEIPEHWEVKALKYIAYMQSGETISPDKFTEEGFPVYGGNGFRGYTDRFTNHGDFALIGRQGALCGNVNYVTGKFYASEHAIVVYPLKKQNVLWLGEAIKVADFNRLSQSAAQPGIAVNVIKNVLFAEPPKPEQNEISNFIKDISSKTDQATNLQQTQIEKLKEYKATLIDAAVTGKIKVR
jgi:type I restriction enzyme S subunit